LQKFKQIREIKHTIQLLGKAEHASITGDSNGSTLHFANARISGYYQMIGHPNENDSSIYVHTYELIINSSFNWSNITHTHLDS